MIWGDMKVDLERQRERLATEYSEALDEIQKQGETVHLDDTKLRIQSKMTQVVERLDRLKRAELDASAATQEYGAMLHSHGITPRPPSFEIVADFVMIRMMCPFSKSFESFRIGASAGIGQTEAMRAARDLANRALALR
jgi:hypothetical protein